MYGRRLSARLGATRGGGGAREERERGVDDH